MHVCTLWLFCIAREFLVFSLMSFLQMFGRYFKRKWLTVSRGFLWLSRRQTRRSSYFDASLINNCVFLFLNFWIFKRQNLANGLVLCARLFFFLFRSRGIVVVVIWWAGLVAQMSPPPWRQWTGINCWCPPLRSKSIYSTPFLIVFWTRNFFSLFLP
jgi:hypothetical protein